MAEPIDLPANVAAQGVQALATAHSSILTDITNNGAVAHNIARLSSVRKFDEIGTLEGRANSGVNATPIASPANQTGGPG